MACEAIIDYLVRESGRYMQDEIFQRSFGTSPWMALTPRGEHPAGVGEVINVLTWERAAPLGAEVSWSNMQIESGQEGGICLPPSTKVRTGNTTRNFQLQRALFEGPELCAEEGRPSFSLATQLNSITSQLTEFSRLVWEQRDRNEYFRLAQTKVIVDGCPPTRDTDGLETWDAVATAQGATCPTSQLTQGILDRERMRLVRDGATPIARLSTGSPLLALMADAETLDGLIRNNADIRQDFRFATQGMDSRADLLQPMGIERAYRGFIHVEDLYPNRYECSGGTYTKVATFVEEAASKEFKAEINELWTTATYTESMIHSRSVYRQLIPNRITNPANGISFDPVNYVGNVMWRNIPSKQCNPLGQIITPYMLFEASSMPEKPQHGVAFVHLRCDPPCDLITSCTT